MAVDDDYLPSGTDADLARARIAALNVVLGRAGARFLAAHGRHEHASALEAALEEMADLLSAQIGDRLFTAALAWAEGCLEGDSGDSIMKAH